MVPAPAIRARARRGERLGTARCSQVTAVLIGALATIAAAVVARLEMGGRRELREIAALVGAAERLGDTDVLRTDLLEDAAHAHVAYRRQVALRSRLLLAVALGTSLFGVALLFASLASQPEEGDVKTPHTVAVVAAVGFVVALFGGALTAIGLLIQIWLAQDHGWLFRLLWTGVLAAIAIVIVYLAAKYLIDLPDFLAATSP